MKSLLVIFFGVTAITICVCLSPFDLVTPFAKMLNNKNEDFNKHKQFMRRSAERIIKINEERYKDKPFAEWDSQHLEEYFFAKIVLSETED